MPSFLTINFFVCKCFPVLLFACCFVKVKRLDFMISNYEWLAKPMLAKPLNDLINFTLSYKVKCKKGVIFRRKRGGIE